MVELLAPLSVVAQFVEGVEGENLGTPPVPQSTQPAIIQLWTLACSALEGVSCRKKKGGAKEKGGGAKGLGKLTRLIEELVQPEALGVVVSLFTAIHNRWAVFFILFCKKEICGFLY